MAHPARLHPDEILATARRLLDAGGPGAVTMQALARSLGVKAPSLYKHLADRTALLLLLEIQVTGELTRAVAGDSTRDAIVDLMAMGQAYRDYAVAHPQAYTLLLSAEIPDLPEVRDRRLAAVAPALRRLAELVGPERSLEAARTLTAYLHGFASMEVAGAFRLGGDPRAAFASGLRALLNGWQQLAALPRDPSIRRGGEKHFSRRSPL